MALIKCSECGGEISDMAQACPKCGKPTGVQLKLKSCWVAAILNFFFWFPGYFYAGDSSLGAIFGFLFVVGIVEFVWQMNLLPITAGYMGFESIIGIFLSIFLAFDGYKRVEKYNQTQLKK